jgi:hypothetical protein
VAVILPGAVLLGVLALAGSRPAVQRCPGGAEAVLLPTAAEVPDLVGLSAEQARAAAEQAGLAWSQEVVRFTVDPADRGTVLEQSGGACEDPLRLVVSSGGPFVSLADVPPAAREALGTDPGLVRRVPLADGYVLQTDAVVVGDCPSVDRFIASGQVGEVGEAAARCYPDAEEALLETLRGGAGFLGEQPRLRADTPGELTWSATGRGDGWVLSALVTASPRREAPECGAPSAYEVCAVQQRPDLSSVRTRQLLEERPPGTTSVSREVVVQGGRADRIRVRLTLAAAFDAEGPVPDRPTETPASAAELTALADAVTTAVVDVLPPLGSR